MKWRLFVGLTMLSMLVSLAHADWKFSGYTQARFNFWDDDINDDSLDLRRARLKFEGPVNDATVIKLQVDVAGLDDDNGKLELRDALITRKLSPETRGAVGFTSVPFGFENAYSSSKRLPLERSEAVNRLFPGQRATGIWFMYHPPANGKTRPQVDLAYTNGMSKWHDEDSSGNEDTDSDFFLARVQWPVLKTGVAGASFMAANRMRDIGGITTDFGNENVFGVHARVPVGQRFTFQGEYLDGEILDVDVNGWYGLVEYAFRKMPKTLFYRFDTFDRQQPSDFERHTVGLAWDFDKNERVTIQAETIENYVGANFTNFAFQYQVKY